MRSILRNIVLYGFSLFVLQLIFAGVTVEDGFFTYFFAGVVLTLLFYTLKPTLSLLTFPLNIATMGFFTILINAFILYITTILLPSITITAFTYPGSSFLGFVIPKIAFNSFFAYVACALVISCITTTLSWLFDR